MKTNNDRLYKQDAVIVVYEKEEGEECFVLNVTSKKGGNYFGKWKDFQPELEDLNIQESEDEWQSFFKGTRDKLIKKITKAGFKVIKSEDYQK